MNKEGGIVIRTVLINMVQGVGGKCSDQIAIAKIPLKHVASLGNIDHLNIQRRAIVAVIHGKIGLDKRIDRKRQCGSIFTEIVGCGNETEGISGIVIRSVVEIPCKRQG